MSFRTAVAPPSPVGYTPDSSNAEGFLLLTIPNATITSTSPLHPIPKPLKGLLSLECITLKVADPLGRDVWLVLRVEPPSNVAPTPASFELPLPATQRILLSRSENRYTLPMSSTGSTGELVLTLQEPKTAGDKEDLETLEVILAQYAALQVQETPSNAPSSSTGRQVNADPDGDLKGRLVLVDEGNGQVVGTLGDQFNVREDPRLRAEGNEKDPVIVEIPEDDQSAPGTPSAGPKKVAREIFVHPINVDDSDWVSKTAGFLSRGVVMATNAITGGVTGATNYYISHSTPSEKPIVFSENTRKNVKRIHNISGTAVKVTAKTTGLIHQTVEMLADKVSGNNNPAPYTPHGSSLRSGGATPYSSSSSTLHSQAASPPPLTPPPKRRLLNRLLTSTDMLLTTLESSAYHLISHTTNSASAAAQHKYGDDAAMAIGTMGDTIRNVGVVYIDARGVGRRALLKTAGKRVMKARMGGKDVVFQGQGEHGVVYGDAPNLNKPNPTPGYDDYRPPAYPPPGTNNMPGGYH
ncbi:hypothetical protein CPB86DRAFT_791071 [Serendipita vermifera]|nr:hypothetical protein CPB86DRAFT_791071 [Serendipita vermifera]